jgi:uncharacterized protein YvpB
VPNFIDKVVPQNRAAKLTEIAKYLDRGYLVIAEVNYRSLHNKEGYVGHCVLIKGYDPEYLYINEPGLPGIENWAVSYDQFIKGWSYPNERSNNLTAFNLK